MAGHEHQPAAQHEGLPAQRTREAQCPHMYLRLRVSFPDTGAGAVDVTERLFADVLQAALQELHGFVGGAVLFDVLHIGADGTGVVRLDRRDVNKVWSSAACLCAYGGHTCRVEVLQAAPFLTALAADSRTFAMDIVAAAAAAAAAATTAGTSSLVPG